MKPTPRPARIANAIVLASRSPTCKSPDSFRCEGRVILHSGHGIDGGGRTMKRRAFLGAAGGLALSTFFASRTSIAQQPLRYADMHAHLAFKQGERMRPFMAQNGMLVVAEKLVPDSPFVRWSPMRQTLAAYRDAQPGEVRRSFDFQFERALRRIRAQDLAMVTTLESLDRVIRERIPAIALSSEGGDFLEGDLRYLETVRARGLVHLQLLHYRLAELGDISTEEPKYGGLSDFG